MLFLINLSQTTGFFISETFFFMFSTTQISFPLSKLCFQIFSQFSVQFLRFTGHTSREILISKCYIFREKAFFFRLTLLNNFQFTPPVFGFTGPFPISRKFEFPPKSPNSFGLKNPVSFPSFFVKLPGFSKKFLPKNHCSFWPKIQNHFLFSNFSPISTPPQLSFHFNSFKFRKPFATSLNPPLFKCLTTIV